MRSTRRAPARIKVCGSPVGDLARDEPPAPSGFGRSPAEDRAPSVSANPGLAHDGAIGIALATLAFGKLIGRAGNQVRAQRGQHRAHFSGLHDFDGRR